MLRFKRHLNTLQIRSIATKATERSSSHGFYDDKISIVSVYIIQKRRK